MKSDNNRSFIFGLVAVVVLVLFVGQWLTKSKNTVEASDNAAASMFNNDVAAVEHAIEDVPEKMVMSNPYNKESTSKDVITSSDRQLANARGIGVDEMTDPSRHYGYTPSDRVFLEEHGISEQQARALERAACAGGVDC